MTGIECLSTFVTFRSSRFVALVATLAEFLPNCANEGSGLSASGAIQVAMLWTEELATFLALPSGLLVRARQIIAEPSRRRTHKLPRRGRSVSYTSKKPTCPIGPVQRPVRPRP